MQGFPQGVLCWVSRGGGPCSGTGGSPRVSRSVSLGGFLLMGSPVGNYLEGVPFTGSLAGGSRGVPRRRHLEGEPVEGPLEGVSLTGSPRGIHWRVPCGVPGEGPQDWVPWMWSHGMSLVWSPISSPVVYPEAGPWKGYRGVVLCRGPVFGFPRGVSSRGPLAGVHRGPLDAFPCGVPRRRSPGVSRGGRTMEIPLEFSH